jgi:hypothetical protein
MTAIDEVFRDLEAGLFLQTRKQQASPIRPPSSAQLTDGLVTITFEARRVYPSRGLIGRDFVAWVDAHGLSVVPGRLASIRVDKSTQRAEIGPRFITNHKLSMRKYLRGLCGQHVRVDENHSPSNLTGKLGEARGEFAVIDLGSSNAFVAVSRITRVLLPVHNFSEET